MRSQALLILVTASCGMQPPAPYGGMPDAASFYHVDLDGPLRVECDGAVEFSPTLSFRAPPACERPGQSRTCVVSYLVPEKRIDHVRFSEYRDLRTLGTYWDWTAHARRGFLSLRDNRSEALPPIGSQSSGLQQVTYPGPSFVPQWFWVRYELQCQGMGDPMIRAFNWEIAYMDLFFAPDP